MDLVAAQLSSWAGRAMAASRASLQQIFMDDLAADQEWDPGTRGSEMSQVNGDSEAGVLEHHCGNTPASRLVTSSDPSQKYFRNSSFPSVPACLWHTCED